jgi:hypothetical protein
MGGIAVNSLQATHDCPGTPSVSAGLNSVVP